MKKTYVKPAIAFEGFSLCTNIAAGCEGIVGTPSQYICGIEGSYPGVKIFSVGAAGSDCDFPGTGDATNNDGYCYHNPTDGKNLFNS